MEHIRTILAQLFRQGELKASKAVLYNSSADIVKYASRAKQKQIKTAKDVLFGVELEFICRKIDIKAIEPALDIGILKSEISLPAFGAEFVSLPYTESELLAKIEKSADSFDAMLRENVYDDLADCGMHVHISKKHFSNLEIARMLYLVCHEDYREYWLNEAKRLSNIHSSYNKLSSQLIADVESNNESVSLAGLRPSRAQAINLTNVNTIEVRIFKSPYNVEDVLHNIKLIGKLVRFVKSGGYELKEFLAKGFTKAKN